MTATYLITGGVDLRTVAGKLGHANSTTTQLIYSHLVKSAENETADMMETFIQTSKEKAQIKVSVKTCKNACAPILEKRAPFKYF